VNLGVAFAPLVPAQILWAAIAVAVVLALLLIVSRSRGGAVRVLALVLIILALANPSLTREDRDPLSSGFPTTHHFPTDHVLHPRNPRPRRRSRRDS